MPLVSILIPCYNAARWIGATLESALNQTWPEKEIIVVDDGSRDDSLLVARKFESRGVRVISQPNRGASAARNAAAAASRGEWLQFLDADDLLAPDKIEKQMVLAAAVGPESALCSNWSRFTHAVQDADFTPQPLCADIAPIEWIVTKMERNAMMHPAAWLVSRSLAERAGPWSEKLSLDDDGDYFNRVVLASAGVRFCRDAISFYRSRLPDSLSGTKSDHAWNSAYESLAQSSRRLLAVENSPRTRHACATAFQRFIYDSYPRAANSRRAAKLRVRELGGSRLKPEGGRWFERACRLLGWRLAKRLQSLR